VKRLKLCLFAAALSAAVSAHAIMKATALVVQPPATYSHDGIQYQVLAVGDELFTGDVLRTGENGRVVVRFTDGSQAALAPNTDVALRRLTPREDPIVTRLSLWRGALRALVKKLSARSSFEVETYNTVVAVKGTDFEVGVGLDKDGKPKTEARCFDTDGGGLDVSGLDRKDIVNVGKGQQTSNSTGDPDRASIIHTRELKKALEKYDKLALKLPPLPAGNPAPAGPAGAPAALPPALQKAQSNFDAAARKAEAAAQDYLKAVASGDVAEQKKDESAVADLRSSAKDLESQLQETENKLELESPPPADKPKEGGNAAPTPAPATTPDASLNRAISEELRQVSQVVKEVALQSKLLVQADAAQGNLLLDKDGFRVQYNTEVLRPLANTVEKVADSKRSDGPNSGTTEFQHVVTFNQDLPVDWLSVYKEALNAPANLSSGSPAFWRTDDVQKAFNPSGDCVCFDTKLQAPVSIGGGLWGQLRDEFYQAQQGGGTGLAQGHQRIDQFGAVVGLGTVSDAITVSSVDTGTALRLTYNSDGSVSGYSGVIFSVDVDVPGAIPALDAATLGSSLYGLASADLSAVGSGTFQLTFSSPAYPGHVVSPLLDKDSFVDAFGEGWR
jgi:hypothetical protein